jgi:hypothetical protein
LFTCYLGEITWTKKDILRKLLLEASTTELIIDLVTYKYQNEVQFEPYKKIGGGALELTPRHKEVFKSTIESFKEVKEQLQKYSIVNL